MKNWERWATDERVAAWLRERPREAWAFKQLNNDDDLRDRVVEAILVGGGEDVFESLARFAEALEHRARCRLDGTLVTPPGIGVRRPHDVWVTTMTRRTTSSGSPYFRVEVRGRDGWLGYFDTTVPQDVERLHKLHPFQLVVIVGEIVERPYDCLVVFGARTRLV